jgi:hypothetical protein
MPGAVSAGTCNVKELVYWDLPLFHKASYVNTHDSRRILGINELNSPVHIHTVENGHDREAEADFLARDKKIYCT